MAEQTASQTVAHRVREVRGKMSRADLAEQLRELGYDGLSVGAIGELERGARRITVDDWLALSAALGVAPIHLLVPFEDPEPINTSAAELGIFNPSTSLKVAANLVLAPLEARGWIRGRNIYANADPEFDQRFYYDETPPPRRYQLDEQVEALREGRKPKVKLAEEITRRFAVRWPKEAINSIPASLLAALLAKELQEEEQ
jgi:hypothetical protein